MENDELVAKVFDGHVLDVSMTRIMLFLFNIHFFVFQLLEPQSVRSVCIGYDRRIAWKVEMRCDCLL